MLTYAKETLAQMAHEIGPLLVDHWREVTPDQERILLEPNWPKYAELEKAGALHIFTARHDGGLVGYFVALLVPNLHSSRMYAYNDMVYIAPEHRKGFAAHRLIRMAEAWLKEAGAAVIMVNVTRKKPFDALLQRMGYSHIENVYSKHLADG